MCKQEKKPCQELCPSRASAHSNSNLHSAGKGEDQLALPMHRDTFDQVPPVVCAEFGDAVWQGFNLGDLLCEACTPPPPDPKKKLIEYLKKHMGVTFTEEEMDTFFEKVDTKLLLEEIYRRQKASRRGEGRRSAAKTGEKGHHPSVKIIPATK